MKRKLILTASVVAVLTFSLLYTDVAKAPGLPIIAIAPKISSHTPTTNFVLDVTISDVTLENTGGYGITAWEVYINFSSTVLNAVSAMEGPWLKTAGTTRKVSLRFDNSTDPGYIIISYSLFPPKTAGALGSGTLCNVTFQVMNPGRSDLYFHKTLLRAYTGSTYLTIDHTVVEGFFQYPHGDINNDGIVNVPDLYRLGRAYSKTSGTPGYDADADLDKDEDVDGADLSIVSTHYGAS